MKNLLLPLLTILLWPPAVFPPMLAGGEVSKEKTLAQEIMESDKEPAPLVKRTDIKTLMETGRVTVLVNGVLATCDHQGCTETPTNFWYDSETGCRSCRCDRHK